MGPHPDLPGLIGMRAPARPAGGRRAAARGRADHGRLPWFRAAGARVPGRRGGLRWPVGGRGLLSAVTIGDAVAVPRGRLSGAGTGVPGLLPGRCAAARTRRSSTHRVIAA